MYNIDISLTIFNVTLPTVDDLEVPLPSEQNVVVDMDAFWNKMETSLVERGLATVAATMCVKAPDNLKDMLVRAKLQFEGFDNATQPQKPHRESVRPAFALCHYYAMYRTDHCL